MSNPTELWKKWEGKLVDGKFPLRQWLGCSDHSAVFLTERSDGKSQKAAIKLIPAASLGPANPDSATPEDDAQLARWTTAAKLSHPHLIRLFECGRCQIDGTRLLYVVMQHAEENLAEILPLRALSAAEATEMLPPAAGALAYIHRNGLVHGHVKPSNILAIDNQLKLSTDGICKAGESNAGRGLSAYDAPEVATAGVSAASDVWSLGSTVVAVLTQMEPQAGIDASANDGRDKVTIPAVTPRLREILEQCLQFDPQKRWTASDLLIRLQSPAAPSRARQNQPVARSEPKPRNDVHTPGHSSKGWILVPIVLAALILLIWAGSKLMGHKESPTAETPAASQPADSPAAQSPAPSQTEKPARSGGPHGSVLQQVMPDVSRNALNTIRGRLKVSVKVAVDTQGNVSEAGFVSAGPSKYFSSHALAAARGWKFAPPQVNGQALASEWTLRFEFGRGSTQVFPTQTKP